MELTNTKLQKSDTLHLQEIGELRTENKKLKDDTQTYTNLLLASQKVNSANVNYFLEDYISKDKIREKIKEIENETWYIESSLEAKQACIEELEELLGDEQNV